MIQTSKEHINAQLQLEPGDRFRVSCTSKTANTTPEMISASGQWFTVSKTREWSDKYNSIPHLAEERIGNRGFTWFHFHMDAIDRLKNRAPQPVIVRTGTLPFI